MSDEMSQLQYWPSYDQVYYKTMSEVENKKRQTANQEARSQYNQDQQLRMTCRPR